MKAIKEGLNKWRVIPKNYKFIATPFKMQVSVFVEIRKLILNSTRKSKEIRITKTTFYRPWRKPSRYLLTYRKIQLTQ